MMMTMMVMPHNSKRGDKIILRVSLDGVTMGSDGTLANNIRGPPLAIELFSPEQRQTDPPT